MSRWGVPLLVAFSAHGALAAMPVQFLSSTPSARRNAPQALRLNFRAQSTVAPETKTEPPPPKKDIKSPKRIRKRKPIAQKKPKAVSPPEVIEKSSEPLEPRASPSVSKPAPPVARLIDFGPYRRGLRGEVLREKRYPRMARRMNLEGRAVVKVRLKRDGQLAAAPRLVRSAGHRSLDQEALAMVSRAAPFAALPSGFEKDAADFVIPIQFRIVQ